MLFNFFFFNGAPNTSFSLQKNPATLSDFSPKNPATSGPLSLQSLGPRHHRPATASDGAAHRRQNQVLFCVFRLDFSFSFRFSSSLTLLWFFLGSISTPCCKNNSKFQVLFLMNHNFLHIFDFLSFFIWVFWCLIWLCEIYLFF